MANIVSLVIKSEDKDISKDIQVINASTNYQANDIGVAKLMLVDGDPAAETFKLSEKAELQPGKVIEILAGYDKGKETTIFKGVITGVTVGKNLHGSLYLELIIHCDSIKLVDFPITKLFDKDQTDDKIIESLLSQSKVTKGTVATSKIKHFQYHQPNQSAWQCLLQRVFANGFLFISTPKDSQVIDLAQHSGAKHPIGITKTGIECFNLQLDSTSQAKSIKTFSWGINKDGKLILDADGSNEKLKDFVDAEKVLSREPWEPKSNLPLTKEELTGWSNTEAAYRKLDLYKGGITCIVSSTNKLDKVVLGDSLTLSGFGKHFNGDLFVTGIEHNISIDGWSVTLTVGLSLAKTILSKHYQDSQPLAQPFKGLMVGTVATYKKEKDKPYHLPVIIDALTGTETIYARLTTPFASNEEGIHFLPNAGDEVIIGFWQADSRYPIILGSVHNSKNKPPTGKDYDEITASGIFLKEASFDFNYKDAKKAELVSSEIKVGEKVSILFDKEKGTTLTNDKTKLSVGSEVNLESEAIKLTAKKDIEIKTDKGFTITAQSTDIK